MEFLATPLLSIISLISLQVSRSLQLLKTLIVIIKESNYSSHDIEGNSMAIRGVLCKKQSIK